ncbi:transcriptional regulator with XRE-family HTH domain [Streptacidiphilus sp. MAP12-20]|uniref:hypothetical protein n=1 Tax=Streptacidiphilus sp. MAP12-20 TaxID=3156299 RepID=UPI00351292AD
MNHARWHLAREKKVADGSVDPPEIVAEREQTRLARALGQLLYDRRTELGLTERDLAARLAGTVDEVAAIETGGALPLTSDLLLRLSAALAVSVDVHLAPGRPAPGAASTQPLGNLHDLGIRVCRERRHPDRVAMRSFCPGAAPGDTRLPVAVHGAPQRPTRPFVIAGSETHRGSVGGVCLHKPMTVHGVIAQLPDPEAVRARSKAMAMLDAVLSPEWPWRYYSYDTKWGASEELASMRDGCGNDYAVVFGGAGVYAQACYHESPINSYRVSPPEPWPGLFESLPDAFRHLEREPAFLDRNGVQRATVCLWRERRDSAWRCGDVEIPDKDEHDADGAEWLFGLLLEGTAEAYVEFAAEYYEMAPALEAVQHVYDLEPLTQEVVSALNPAVQLEDLAEDAAQIGYPV